MREKQNPNASVFWFFVQNCIFSKFLFNLALLLLNHQNSNQRKNNTILRLRKYTN